MRRRAEWSPMRGRRVWAAVLVTLAVLVALPAVAIASVPPPDERQSGESLRWREEATLRLAGTPGHYPLFAWSGGRRVYSFGPAANGASPIFAYDADSGARLASGTVRPPLLTMGANNPSAGQTTFFPAVDEAGGRLFLPYGRKGLLGAESNAVAGGEACGHLLQCFSGFVVVDAVSLEIERTVKLQAFRADGGAVGARLRAMSYSPPRFEGDRGKVLALIEDRVNSGDDGQNHPGTMTGTNLNYVAQFDPDTGLQEWIVRLDACRGGRESTNDPGLYPVYYHGAVFRGVDGGRPFVYAGCHATGYTGTIVRVPLDEAGRPLGVRQPDPGTVVGEAAGGQAPSAGDVAAVAPPSPEVFLGPRNTVGFIVDPPSERILLRVFDGNPKAEVWWVFDGRRGEYIGTIGIGPFTAKSAAAGLDPHSGRLYVGGPRMRATFSRPAFAGGMFVADIRRTPVPQALHLPHLASVFAADGQKLDGTAISGGGNVFPIVVVAADETRPPKVFVRPSTGDDAGATFANVLEDHIPHTADPPDQGYEGRSLDLQEIEGVTDAVFDGAARGYGVRALFVGGLETVARAGSIDPTFVTRAGTWVPWQFPAVRGTLGPEPYLNPCGVPEREVSFGFVGSDGAVVVDANGGRGNARPVVYDSTTASDLENPVSRCGGVDWEQIWTKALFGAPPTGEPSIDQPWPEDAATCAAKSGQQSGSWGDPVGTVLAAQVTCDNEETSGFSYARGANVPGAEALEAVSSFRIYRDPGRGIVSRVESIARGVNIGGVVSIDTVRGVAESWANGRRQPVLETEREAGYDANCDFERTAGTCFQRHLMGVRTPGYSCGPCGDEARAVDAISKALGANARVQLREPDPHLARGAENGFIAAVQKPDHERFSDLVLNNDLLQTVVPVLQIIRYATPQHVSGDRGMKGRQIYQFAGVEVSSSYGISCLLVYDPEAGTCAAAVEEPGSLTVVLTDPQGDPLAGGAFEVRADTDGDGVVGLVDTLVPDGACLTAQDGTGTCRFEHLTPGPYLVSQTAAPAGYGVVEEPWVSQIAPGEVRTVTFTNASNVSVVEVSAADEAGRPLAGAVFAIYPDPDADGKIAPDAAPAATCTTGSDGTCTMTVPAGTWVLVQTAAPAGLAPITPLAFALTSGGQTAAVGVTNYPPDSPPQAPPAAGPITTRPPDPAPPVETIEPADPGLAGPPPPSVADQVGGTITRVIRAPGDTLRLLARSPREAAAFTATLTLLCLAALAIRRRATATALTRQ